MKKVFSLVFISLLLLCLSGCSILELIKDDDDIVDLGSGETIAKWNLVWNNNEYRPVETAYFEFDNTNFKYYENGELKKEGSHRITYFGVENTISPLHLNLNFGSDGSGFSIYDYIDCYTEDSKDNLAQGNLFRNFYPLKIGAGCHGKCKYCTIRHTRGENYETVALEQIEEFLKFDDVI